MVSGADAGDEFGPVSLSATEPAENHFHHTLRNSHGGFPAHTSAPWRVKEEYAGFTPEQANDAVVGHV